MNTNLSRYRILKAEEREAWQTVNTMEFLLVQVATKPGDYNEEERAVLVKERSEAREQVEKITEEIRALSRDPEVMDEIKKEQGILPSGEQPMMRLFTEIEEKKVPWLWYPYLPIGRLTILEGDPGQGKSWFSLAIATCVSIGSWLEIMPGEESYSTPAGVVYATSEDDPEDTIKKRLRILQADQRRIAHLSGKIRSGKAQGVTIKDLNVFREACSRLQAKLLIIDPIQAYLPKGADMNKAEQIRPLLSALQAIATEQHVAVLLVRHLAKGSKDKALYKGMGSIDFTAAARSVLVCAEQKQFEQWSDPEPDLKPRLISRRFAVSQVKNNLSARGPAVQFELRKDEFSWIGTVELTAEQLLNPEDGSVQQAKSFLLTILQPDGLVGNEVQKKARGAGISSTALEAAKIALNVTIHSDINGWTWSLPGKYILH